jgi:hypothetical protein
MELSAAHNQPCVTFALLHLYLGKTTNLYHDVLGTHYGEQYSLNNTI